MNLKHAFLYFLLSTSGLADDSMNPGCKADKRVVAACFKVHGRLSNWNGNPTGRIWVIGTNRTLGIREDTKYPVSLRNRLGNFDDVVIGDFDVCPLTRERKGWMQIVCVASVSGIKVTIRNH